MDGARPENRQLVFAEFRLDLANQQLWRDETAIPLRPKVFAVLRRLLDQPGQLVTRDEVSAAAWPDTVVSESVLRGAIRELRDALGDDATAPRFIQTIPHRGYRFVAEVHRPPVRGAGGAKPSADDADRPRDLILIGRDAELARLERALERAGAGARQVVFITGEPGIGKTTLVDAFLAAADGADRWTARGQCVEHYGSGEAYLPVLEALGQLCRQANGADVIAVLARHAPTWLAQMPGLVGDAELEAVQRRAQGATRERMLRELAEAVEALTAAKPLVLALEDLHWSDYSTVDLISSLAQRRSPARVLLLGTYRPADVAGSGHPLRGLQQELRVHEQCEELPLRFLTDVEVGAYLSARFPLQQLPPQLGQAIHRGTEGNPLFVVNVVDDWLRRDVLVESAGRWQLAHPVEDLASVPESLRQLIDKQLSQLSADECRLLEVASVAGREFATAAVACGLESDVEPVEERCEALARRDHFLRARETESLADGSVAGRYEFRHALYQQVLYERVAAARRVRLHRRIGEWQERFLRAPARERAAQLAMHFERGEERARAIDYLAQAADNALRRQAPHDAVVLLRRALALLDTLPESAERAQHELALRVAIGVPLLMTAGYAATEVERTYARAHALCREVGESPQLLPALAGLFRFYFVRAEFPTARSLGEQVLQLARHTQDPVISLVAHSLLGVLLLSAGELVAAREHLQQGIALYDPSEHRFMAQLYGDDPGVTCHSFLALTLWFMGYPDQALGNVERALALARQMESPYAETFALDFVSLVHILRRDERAAQAALTALAPIATAHGFPFLLADSQVLLGWSLAAQGKVDEGLAMVQPAITAYAETGAAMSRPSHLSMLAKVYLSAGRTDDGLAAVASALALVELTGERSYEAEIYRLLGELLLAGSPGKTAQAKTAAVEAEASFLQGLEVARRQQARSLELRLAISLGKLWQRQGRTADARTLLSEIYGSFSEGLDTADLQDARALLAALG